MTLVDRLLRRPSGDPGDWGPEPDDAYVDRLQAIARSGDPAADDPRLMASRSAVLTAFAAGQAAAGAGEPRPATAAAAPGIRRGGRRPAVALATAALVVMAGAGAVAGTSPGGPLYDARVAAEEILLPAGPQDRPQAQVERLARRLAEAERALTSDDPAAARASLAAFVRIAIATAGEPPPDPIAAAALAARVRLQLEVLARLGASDPTLAAPRGDAEVAARRLLAALGFGEPAPGPGDPGGPGGPGAEPSPSAPPTATPAPSTPGGSGRPVSPTAAPRQTARPSGPSASPSGTSAPGSTTGPGPATTPRPTAAPTTAPGGGGPDPGTGGSAAPDPGGSGGGDGSPTPSPGGPGSGPGGGSGGG